MMKKLVFLAFTAALLCSCAVSRPPRPLDQDEAMITFMSPGSERVRVLIDNQLYDRRTVRVNKYYNNPYFKRTSKNAVNVGPGVHDVRVYNNNGNAIYQEGVMIINNENKTVNIYNQQQSNDPRPGGYANPQPGVQQPQSSGRTTGGQSAGQVNDVRGASATTRSRATTTTGSSSRATGSNPPATQTQTQPAQQKASAQRAPVAMSSEQQISQRKNTKQTQHCSSPLSVSGDFSP